MRVIIPSSLRSYTGGEGEVEASGSTVAELIVELDRRYPGLRFRVIDEQDALRPHIRVSVNCEIVADLSIALKPDDEVALIQAYSGG
ncbi:MAG: MoaD/ThiS family protein [Elusimicrobia bacterium]|nr:MoaD/ThiS family protein [Elusimicrobiota bacterium]